MPDAHRVSSLNQTLVMLRITLVIDNVRYFSHIWSVL
jgi:hypothetical protein